MITFCATRRPRLVHHGKARVVRDRYQRPEIFDVGPKWKIVYWDYTTTPRSKRSKVWAKSKVPSKKQAQRLADQFMEDVNKRNNEPTALPAANDRVKTLYDSCRDLTWPHLKSSTRKQYEFFFTTYINPQWEATALKELSTVDLQEWFNTFHPRLAPKTIRLMHATFRAALGQAVAWGWLTRNPAIGVKLPRKKARKPAVLLTLDQLRQLLELLPEPAKSVITLIVFASMRAGEVLALRWSRVLSDRICVRERVYDGEFDDVKTEAGEREVPFDHRGIIEAALQRTWTTTKFRNSDDLVFANSKGRPIDRHNLLNRQIKTGAAKLGLPAAIDFRSFRSMHSSLLRRTGARPEIARDNMGHSETDVTLDIYTKVWWDERVEAVSRAVDAVLDCPKQDDEEADKLAKKPAQSATGGGQWVPHWVPQEGS